MEKRAHFYFLFISLLFNALNIENVERLNFYNYDSLLAAESIRLNVGRQEEITGRVICKKPAWILFVFSVCNYTFELPTTQNGVLKP